MGFRTWYIATATFYKIEPFLPKKHLYLKWFASWWCRESHDLIKFHHQFSYFFVWELIYFCLASSRAKNRTSFLLFNFQNAWKTLQIDFLWVFLPNLYIPKSFCWCMIFIQLWMHYSNININLATRSINWILLEFYLNFTAPAKPNIFYFDTKLHLMVVNIM